MAFAGKISIYGDIVPSSVDGPGDRAVIHFAGCAIGCPGCFNPLTHDFSDTASGVWRDDAKSISQKILAVSSAVTISGGEPTDQPLGLLALLRELRLAGCDDIVMFTGRVVGWLEKNRPSLWSALIEERLVDTVIDGPFMERRTSETGLRGSDNQTIHQITDKWAAEDFEDRDIEFTFAEDGSVILTGFPDQDVRDFLSS